MVMTELSWREVERFDGSELLLDVEAATAVLLVRGRNAWHSTWVRHHFKNATLFNNVVDAWGRAERMRTQGNVFYVFEVPVILLRSAERTVIVRDADSSDPFNSFNGIQVKESRDGIGVKLGGVYPGVPLSDATRTFKGSSEFWAATSRDVDRVTLWHADRDVVFQTKDDNLVSLVSESYGSQYELHWASNPGFEGLSTAGARAVAEAWRAQVRKADSVPFAIHMSRQEKFLLFRQLILKGMPLSEWRLKRDQQQSILDFELDKINVKRRGLQSRRKELSDELVSAQEEQQRAMADRLAPADTSSGIRAQRERLERATEVLDEVSARVATELADLELELRDAEAGYKQFLREHFSSLGK